jgi:hypothetical protein
MFRVSKYDNRLMLNEGTGNFRPILNNIPIKISSIFLLSYFFLTQTLTKKNKRIAIKNLEKSYQDRQTSAKSRNLFFKFKDFQLFFAGALSQLTLLNVFLTQYGCLTTKKKNCHQKLLKQLSRPTSVR